MKYRNFAKLDWEVSALGFGIMRLPHKENESSAILEEKAHSLLAPSE